MESWQEKRYTFADFSRWDDDQRWELIDGHPYAMSSPLSIHQILSTELLFALRSHFSGHPCRVLHAPMDVKLSEHDVVQPDLLVVCEPGQILRTHIEGPPRLVIEILSESTQRHDRLRKLNLYGRAGVPEYWLVTPHPPMLEVLQNRDGLFTTVGAHSETGVLISPAFPELRLELGPIFASLPPQPPIDEVRESVPAYAVAGSRQAP